jgi:hypothetical protein
MLFDVVLPVLWALLALSDTGGSAGTGGAGGGSGGSGGGGSSGGSGGSGGTTGGAALSAEYARVSAVLNDSFRVVFVDEDPPDWMDDRVRILTPHHAPVYASQSPFGNVCEPGAWCVYPTVYGE